MVIYTPPPLPYREEPKSFLASTADYLTQQIEKKKKKKAEAGFTGQPTESVGGLKETGDVSIQTEPPKKKFGQRAAEYAERFREQLTGPSAIDQAVAMNKMLRDTNTSQFLSDRNNTIATYSLQQVRNSLYKAYKYNLDMDGNMTGERKFTDIFKQPSYSDTEAQWLQKQIGDYNQRMQRLKAEEQAYSAAEKALNEEISNPSGGIDIQASREMLRRYINTGEFNGGNFIIPTSNNIQAQIMQSKDPRSPEQRKPDDIGLDPKDPTKKMVKYPGMSQDAQTLMYIDTVNKTPQNQRGSIDDMLRNASGDELYSSIYGAFDDYDPTAPAPKQAEFKVRADKLIMDYGKNPTPSLYPNLLEASMNYGMSQGYASRFFPERIIREDAAQWQVDRATDKTEQIKDKPTQRLKFGGTEIKAKDLRGEGYKVQDIDRLTGTPYKYDKNKGWIAVDQEDLLTVETDSGKKRVDVEIVAVDDGKMYMNKNGVLYTIPLEGNRGLLASDKDRAKQTTGSIVKKGLLDK